MRSVLFFLILAANLHSQPLPMSPPEQQGISNTILNRFETLVYRALQ